MSLRLKKNDRVVVLSGKDKGKEGKIIKVFPKEGKAIVEGINRVKKHVRPTQKNPQGGIITKEAPIYLCKLMLICPNCGEATRFSAGFDTLGNKVRICKKCKEIIDRKE